MAIKGTARQGTGMAGMTGYGGPPTTRPNTAGAKRLQQARKDFATFGMTTPVDDREAGRQEIRMPMAAGTHGIMGHCPGSIAFGLLGGAVVKHGN